jgi:hypothetical protein
MIPEVFLQIIVRHDLFTPPGAPGTPGVLCRVYLGWIPEEAETSRNSLSWTILQGTPLF